MGEVICSGVSARATRATFNFDASFIVSAALTMTLGSIVAPAGPARAQAVGPRLSTGADDHQRRNESAI
jgi:hypothetical protein